MKRTLRGAVSMVLVAALGTLACGAEPEEATGEVALARSAGCGLAPPVAPGESGALSLTVGELERRYVLHLPPAYDSARPLSLMLDFHGYTGTAESEEEYTGLSRHADAHGYAVVYPQGTAFLTEDGDSVTSWNDLAGSRSSGPEGPICSEDAFEYPHPPECGDPTPCTWATCHDDLAFVEQLLDTLEQTVCVDLDRVYATGMSNGGMFVHRLGCAMPERFAAIAPVGGTLARGFNCAPGPSTPLSMMNVNGRRDDYVSQKGVVSSDGYYYTSAADVMSRWASPEAQNCKPATTPYPTSADGLLGIDCYQHPDCATGAEVVHCDWDGEHDWPQAEGIDAGNQIIWEFFSKHSRGGGGSR